MLTNDVYLSYNSYENQEITWRCRKTAALAGKILLAVGEAFVLMSPFAVIISTLTAILIPVAARRLKGTEYGNN